MSIAIFTFSLPSAVDSHLSQDRGLENTFRVDAYINNRIGTYYSLILLSKWCSNNSIRIFIRFSFSYNNLF